MKDAEKSQAQLMNEVAELRHRVAELEAAETERKRAEGALRKAHDELGKRLKERTADLKATNKKVQRDITTSNQMEEALQQSEERFRKIYDHSNDAIFVIDPAQDEILDVNTRACTMLGYAREELLSLPVSAVHYG